MSHSADRLHAAALCVIRLPTAVAVEIVFRRGGLEWKCVSQCNVHAAIYCSSKERVRPVVVRFLDDNLSLLRAPHDLAVALATKACYSSLA